MHLKSFHLWKLRLCRATFLDFLKEEEKITCGAGKQFDRTVAAKATTAGNQTDAFNQKNSKFPRNVIHHKSV